VEHDDQRDTDDRQRECAIDSPAGASTLGNYQRPRVSLRQGCRRYVFDARDCSRDAR
jgi:hypothetical protein